MKELINANPDLLITVVGIGGCGCNTVNMLYENNLSDSVNLIAINTDLAALNSLNVENKILIGEDLTKGYGAGSNPYVGLKAAQESEELLINAITGSDIVIITAGFGGGTGTGASPLVARIARELNINCLAIVTLPFESEGKLRMDFALKGIAEIKEPIHAYITLSNDLLLKGLGESVGLFSAFNQSNEVLKNLLVSLVQMLTETGYVNVDKNDFASILSYEGESILGVGKTEDEEQAFEALDQALQNPLVSIANIDTAKGIIFQLFCKSEPITQRESGEFQENFRCVVRKGRHPDLCLTLKNRCVPLKEITATLLQDIQPFAELLDGAYQTKDHTNEVNALRVQLTDLEQTLSGRLVAEISKQQQGFFGLGLELSQSHLQHFKNRPLAAETLAAYQSEAKDSHQRKKQMEESDKISFEAFLANYYE